jgi:CheY-like chemotaxis protein
MNTSAKRILIVEDDPDITFVLVALLEEVGYAVSTAERGEELAHLDTSALPDLIVLDLYLSGLDGRQIARQLKGQEATRQIPIVMLSAHPDAPQDAKDAGADAFLAKPFDLDMVLQTVNTFLA